MLTSRQNPLVKTLRSLHGGKGRSLHQQFLLEGTHLIEAALATEYPLEVVCCSDRWCDTYPDLWQSLQDRVPRQEIFSEELLNYAASTIHPDGVLGIAPLPVPQAPQVPKRLGLFLQTIQDPGNVGTILRTAVATGVEQVCLSADSVDVTHPKLLRSSAGYWFDALPQVCPDSREFLQQCHGQGVQIIATSSHRAQSYWDVDFKRPTVLVMGNEGAGLSPDLLDLADQTIGIPLNPKVESLNVAIATAVILYEIKRQTEH